MEWTKDGYLLTDERERVDVGAVHAFLSSSYWAAGIPREIVERSLDGSLAFSLFEKREQVGFARVVTDRATFAYLCDVYVLPAHRGKGLGLWMVRTATEHLDLRHLRRWMLGTRDAHGLYEKVGFKPLADPARFLERHDPEVYARLGAAGPALAAQLGPRTPRAKPARLSGWGWAAALGSAINALGLLFFPLADQVSLSNLQALGHFGKPPPIATFLAQPWLSPTLAALTVLCLAVAFLVPARRRLWIALSYLPALLAMGAAIWLFYALFASALGALQ